MPTDDQNLSPEIKRLRRRAPRYFRELIEKSYIFINYRSLEPLKASDVKLLGGGFNAVTYLVRQQDDYVVVKFDYRGVKAEAEALEAWSNRAARVARVKSQGSIASTRHYLKPVRYIIFEGVVCSKGQPAPLADNYLKKFPGRAKSIGAQLGHELALMHKATTKRTFGEFADMEGDNTRPYKTWNAFLIRYIKFHHDGLLSLGYSEAQLKRLRGRIKAVKFPRTGRYLHGDFGPRNAVIETARPLRLRVIDPNPLIGHPTWDIASLIVHTDYSRRKSELKPTQATYRADFVRRRDILKGLMPSYLSVSGHKINDQRLNVTILVQQIFLYFVALDTATRQDRVAVKDELIVRRQALISALDIEFANSKLY